MNFKMVMRTTALSEKDVIWLLLKVFKPLKTETDGASGYTVEGAEMVPFSQWDTVLLQALKKVDARITDVTNSYTMLSISFTPEERKQVVTMKVAEALEK